MVFWSKARSDVGCFFYRVVRLQITSRLDSCLLYLWFLALLDEGVFTLLLLALLFPGEVFGFADLV